MTPSARSTTRGEFHWRLTNATHAHGGFLNALRGWHEALDAKAFQQEEAATHVLTSGLVILNGLVVALIAISMFGMLVDDFETHAGHDMKTQFSTDCAAAAEPAAFWKWICWSASRFSRWPSCRWAIAFARERQVLKMEYVRSVADEIVDGEMEILAAGAGKDFPDGAQTYSVHASAAASSAAGTFSTDQNRKSPAPGMECRRKTRRRRRRPRSHAQMKLPPPFQKRAAPPAFC